MQRKEEVHEGHLDRQKAILTETAKSLRPRTYNEHNSDIRFLYQLNWAYPISSLMSSCEDRGAKSWREHQKYSDLLRL